MHINRLSSNHLSSLLFELGLALRLNKVTVEDVSNKVSVTKIKKLIEVVESKEYSNWNDSHIKPEDRLKSALEIHGISQAELAKELNVPPQKINDLIKGRITITKTWARKIANVLSVNYKVFL